MKTIFLISPYWKEEHRWMVSTVKLAELWQRRGCRVVVCCMGAASRVEEVSPTLTIHYRKDVFLPDPWNYGIALGFGGYVSRLAQELKPHHIVVNKVLFWSSFSLLRLRFSGFPVTLITDALVGMTWWPWGLLPRLAAAVYGWTGGWLILLAATRVVFFHPQPAGLLRMLGIAGKSRVIPTGIDESAYGPPTRDSGRVTVTYVGRLESVKGVDDFLAAAVPLVARHPAMHVQVVGWYKEGHPLVEEYKDRAEFLGLRTDIPSILSRSDIFVLPSYSEGLSNALMEAMASSCACIASAVGGNKYLLAEGAGLLFSAGDREALGAVLEQVLQDGALRAALGRKARQRIENFFSWKSVGERYDELFASA